MIGIFNKNKEANVSELIYYGLISLQHRGQESSGIVCVKNGKMRVHKRMALVQESFDKERIDFLRGNIGIGHVRYSSVDNTVRVNTQPLAFTYKGGSIALGHSGNIVNSPEIKSNLEANGAIFQTTIDTEVIAHLIAKHSKNGFKKAILETLNTIKGSFSISLILEDKLIAIRDPYGIKPLSLGRLSDGSYIIASESVAIDVIGGEFVRDIEPGEMIIISDDGIESIIYDKRDRKALSSFEYVYFARPDSVIDNISVYASRKKAGEILAKNHHVDADIVIPVPDSGRSAAIGYSGASKIPYGEGLIKNKYVGRTFIQPTQLLREDALRMKLNVLKETIYGKKIVLVDDSIVRGTTSRKIIAMLREKGAKEIHFRISSPPVSYPSYYGIDTPKASELIAYKNNKEEIRKIIGADSLEYLTVDELVESIGIDKNDICLDCFTGEYPVSIPDYCKHE